MYILLWELDGNGNTVIRMGGNGIERVNPAHFFYILTLRGPKKLVYSDQRE